MKNSPLLVAFKKRNNIFLFICSFLVLYGLNYLVMKSLPGTNGFQCLPHSMNAKNVIFSVIMSTIMAVFIVGMKELLTLKKNTLQQTVSGVSIFSVSGIIGFFTIICPICTLGVVSLFGVSFGLNFLLDFNIQIKIISILLMIFGIYWINGQLAQDCKICNFVNKKK